MILTIILSFILLFPSAKASNDTTSFESVLISGHVRVVRTTDGKRENLEFKTPANEPPVLKEGDLLLSLIPSRILLKTSAVIELKERTKIKLEKLAIENGIKNSVIHVFEGLIKNSISSLRKNETYQVKNKDAAMSVRGTVVIVEVEPEKTQPQNTSSERQTQAQNSNTTEAKTSFTVTCVEGEVQVEKKTNDGTTLKQTIKTNEQVSIQNKTTANESIQVTRVSEEQIKKLDQNTTVSLNFSNIEVAQDKSPRLPASIEGQKEDAKASDLDEDDTLDIDSLLNDLGTRNPGELNFPAKINIKITK